LVGYDKYQYNALKKAQKTPNGRQLPYKDTYIF